MDKNINDEDRIVIGVREWAVETVLGDKWVGTNLVKQKGKGVTKDIVEAAAKLEEYVLRGVADIVVLDSSLYVSDGKVTKKIY